MLTFALAACLQLSLGIAGEELTPRPQAQPGAANRAPTVESPHGELTALVDRLLDAKALAKAQVSVNVVDTATGRTVYARNAKLSLNPASNTKLITTAAVLAGLGPSHEFRTRALALGPARKDGVLEGDLYIRADADPSLVSGNLYELGLELAALGIRKITGQIVLDTSRFDREGWPPGFEQKDEVASYRTPVGAGSINYNTFVLWIRPGESAGAGVFTTAVPESPGLQVINEATTSSGGAFRARLDSELLPDGSLRLTLRGTVGVKSAPRSYRLPVLLPSAYTLSVLHRSLKDAGITLSRRPAKTGEVPAQAVVLATHRSQPLSVLIRAVNKHSNNFMAEQLLWALAPGPKASIEDALARVRSFTREVGMPQQDLSLGNGSGLYDNNRVSAEQFTTLLTAIHRDFRLRDDFVASLAIMGVDGTTRRRLRNRTSTGWVRAKTGTLEGVCALSGYAGAPGQAPLAFSIVVNGFDHWRIGQVQRIQDEIVHALVSYLRHDALQAIDPEAPPAETITDEIADEAAD